MAKPKIDPNRYVCHNCGSKRMTLNRGRSGTRINLVCMDCGKVQTWSDNKTINRDYIYISQFPENKNKVLRKTNTIKGVTRVRCQRCQCLLTTFGMPPPDGQYDLVNAIFCPQCGAELL